MKHSGTAGATASRKPTILVLAALLALGSITVNMYLPALPGIAEEFSVSSWAAQLTLTGTLLGLAIGQLIIGPISDSLGRRRPVIAGVVLHMLASMLCLAAPSVTTLGLARSLQGVGAASAAVVAMAVVGDVFAESDAAAVMSRLMLVLGVAPVLAPLLGAAVLLWGSWRWVFVALLMLAGVLLLTAVRAMPETLPTHLHRRPLQVRSILSGYSELLRDSRFLILVVVAASAMSGLFGYVSAAPFVLQDQYDLDRLSIALVFATGAVVLIGATQFNVVLLRWSSSRTITVSGLSVALVAGLVLVGLTLAQVGGLIAFLALVLVILAAMGLVIPNASALALSSHPGVAGTAAALLGATQFGVGAAVAPLIGGLGNRALALAVVMTSGVMVALALLVVIGPRRPQR
ncbi:Bcr/CflA family efflux MFS transporter [Mycobacterium aquaticum]|uniref:Bcr/CflA family drug resistance efflux transporter n=1 Tax=Mycobacterium aquaticum TaxID=1927124 RepID=A0A1W9ZZJ3_9MYCO|nr:Bcr/CflA family efflux MFS transporter [Mycobacterium aquaticum]ORA22916.1 Bcr/CflA family drug resistance efflux transporter [Mycobacterium aquaticum]